MKIYRGYRVPLESPSGPRGASIPQVIVEEEDGSSVYTLEVRLDLRNHSPTGFEWGDSGSGPAQLALALCADAIQDDQRALRLYQEFKRICVATLPREAWELWETEVLLMCVGISLQQGGDSEDRGAHETTQSN